MGEYQIGVEFVEYEKKNCRNFQFFLLQKTPFGFTIQLFLKLDLYAKKSAFWYRGVGIEKCQLRHDCLIVYGTNCVCDKENIIINYDHLPTFSQIKQVEYYLNILLWCFFG